MNRLPDVCFRALPGFTNTAQIATSGSGVVVAAVVAAAAGVGLREGEAWPRLRDLGLMVPEIRPAQSASCATYSKARPTFFVILYSSYRVFNTDLANILGNIVSFDPAMDLIA